MSRADKRQLLKTPLRWPEYPQCPVRRVLQLDDARRQMEFATVKVTAQRTRFVYYLHVVGDPTGQWIDCTPEALIQDGWVAL